MHRGWQHLQLHLRDESKPFYFSIKVWEEEWREAEGWGKGGKEALQSGHLIQIQQGQELRHTALGCKVCFS